MDDKLSARIEEYMDLLKVLTEKTRSELVAINLLQEIAKDRRMDEMRQDREKTIDEPATERQKKFMKKLGIKIPKDLTKKQASNLIDEELGNSSNEE